MSNDENETTLDAGEQTCRDAAPHPAAMPSIPGFQVLGKLGEGGMGVVWKAIQLSTKRPVALKLMSAASFGSERARLRFEREVELTAKLDHPHIARVYESGLVQGVCFYAMELIEGQKLDDFVKAKKPTRVQIIELMKVICRAVQYAHQKGIIHRDLKPANILADKEGQPRVMDFGLAKAMEGGQQLSIDGAVAGTPAFMSPEQAAGKLDSLDTRSDVYTLGVILFHLLSGKFPHNVSGSSLEVMRRISQEEPRRLKEIEPRADRELEILLSKALAREPERRYGSAGELADDLDRYLKHEPLNAQPPTVSYLLRKKFTKYRVPVAIAAGVCALLLATAVWAYVRVSKERNSALAANAEKERQVQETEKQRREAIKQGKLADANALQSAKNEAEARKQAAIAEAVSQFQSDMLAAANPARLLGDKVTVLQATHEAIKELDAGSFKDEPLVEAGVRNTIGNTLESLGRYDEAEPMLRRALEIRRKVLPAGHPDIATSLINLAATRCHQNKPAEAEVLYREALEINRKALPAGHPRIAVSMNDLASLLQDQNKLSEAERMYRQALDINRKALPPGHPDIARSLHNLAEVLRTENKLAEAEPLYRKALEIQRNALPAAHPVIAMTLNNLAELLRTRNDFAEAEPLYREALGIQRRVLPAGHPDIATTLNNLALLLRAQDKPGEAEPLVLEALEIRRKALPAGHPDIAMSLNNLAVLRLIQNKPAEAETLLREALAIYRKALPAEHPDIATSLNNLASVLMRQDKLAEAEPLLREALKINRKALPAGHPAIANTLTALATLLSMQNNLSEAETLLREALAVRTNDLGANDATTILTAKALADLLDRAGRAKEAKAIRKELVLDASATQPATRTELSPTAPFAPTSRSTTSSPATELLAAARAHAAAGRPLAAAAKFSEAFAADARLVDSPVGSDARFEAGMAAARCALGIGSDAANLSDADRAGWRKKALEWFRADVAIGAWQIDTGDRAAREAAVSALRRMEREPDLANLRDDEAVLKLAAEESSGWIELWTHIQELRNKAAGKDN